MIAKPFNNHFKFATDLTIIAKKVMLVKSAPVLNKLNIDVSYKLYTTADNKNICQETFFRICLFKQQETFTIAMSIILVQVEKIRSDFFPDCQNKT